MILPSGCSNSLVGSSVKLKLRDNLPFVPNKESIIRFCARIVTALNRIISYRDSFFISIKFKRLIKFKLKGHQLDFPKKQDIDKLYDQVSAKVRNKWKY